MTDTFTTNINGFTEDIGKKKEEENTGFGNLYYNGKKFLNNVYNLERQKKNTGKILFRN